MSHGDRKRAQNVSIGKFRERERETPQEAEWDQSQRWREETQVATKTQMDRMASKETKVQGHTR